MGKIATRSYCNSIASGAFSTDLNRCPTRTEISTTNKFNNHKLSSFASNQLIEEVNIEVKPSEVLFTVTIDSRNSDCLEGYLNIAYRFQLSPGTYAFRTGRQVGYITDRLMTTHNTGPFDLTETYGNSNVLLWSGPVGFNYSYSNIEGTSGIIYAPAGSGTYKGTNPGQATGTNLEYITLFNQPISVGDSISLSVTIY